MASHCSKARKRNKRHIDWKGDNKTVSICRQQIDCLEMLPTIEISQKTPRTNKQVQRGHRITEQHTKVSCISIE